MFHPRLLRPYCRSTRLEWKTSSGRGSIYSFTLQHIPLHRERPGVLPRILGIVRLEEGFHMFSDIASASHREPRIGAPVLVYFDRVANDLALPKFRME